ncbi:zinc-binding dehydrogenase [Streptomyces sp. 8ZJF_21]|uniref:zinc-binding dehydrogenase n=1 Tax=Streptomyces sp. 8ZJF_21 TaxID=2903141 RepID=UPI001E4EF812|nr:zinc-binding dehydrogenase [Streptomyces sp. 8ZJF_21]MCD9592058.1 zinc-binding dehydrogenase [Streptomyces sp. 8ZJF_21]
MDAIVIEQFGDAEVLRPGRVPDPPSRSGWTTVRLHTAALNWHDVLVRRGLYASPLPHLPGADGAGTTPDGEPVVILPALFWGAREAAPAPGWELLGDARHGTYAQFVSVPDECLAPRPAGFSWAEAAALPLVGATAFRALVTRAELTAGESVLILGAGGGLAPGATAIAKAIGALPFVTSSSDEKIAVARTHGAVAGVRYTDEDWIDQARAMSPGGDGYDVVLDSVGTWGESLRALRPGGRLVVLGASQAEQATLAARPFYFGQYSLLGTTMGSPADFRGLFRLVAEGRLGAPTIDSTFALSDAADAHRRLESDRAYGKIVLLIA